MVLKIFLMSKWFMKIYLRSFKFCVSSIGKNDWKKIMRLASFS